MRHHVSTPRNATVYSWVQCYLHTFLRNLKDLVWGWKRLVYHRITLIINESQICDKEPNEILRAKAMIERVKILNLAPKRAKLKHLFKHWFSPLFCFVPLTNVNILSSPFYFIHAQPNLYTNGGMLEIRFCLPMSMAYNLDVLKLYVNILTEYWNLIKRKEQWRKLIE